MIKCNGFLTFSEAMDILKAGGMVASTDWPRFEYITLEKGKVDPGELSLDGLLNGYPRDLFEASGEGSYSYPSIKYHDVYSFTSTYHPSASDVLRARWTEITPADLDVPDQASKCNPHATQALWRSVI